MWLGALASWRAGLVGRLVEEYGSVSEVLDRPVAELRAFLRPRRERRSAATHDCDARAPGAAPCGTAGATAARGSAPGSLRSVAGAPADGAAERAAERAAFLRALSAAPSAWTAVSLPTGRLQVAWSDILYPPALRRLADPPLCLFVAARAADAVVRERLELLCGALAVAVVGTRGPSPYGGEMAALLARDLALRGVTVVSGLALGVDAVAQAAALRAGAG